MERTCKKCGETKLIEEFVKNKNCSYGREHLCNDCKRTYLKSMYHTQEYKDTRSKYRIKNKERLKKEWDKWYQENRNIVIERSKNHYKANKDEILQSQKIYYQLHKEHHSLIAEKYRESHKKEIYLKDKKYRESHKDELFKKKKNYREISKDELNDHYILKILYGTTGLPSYLLRQNPELIEAQRVLIKLKRLVNDL